MELNMRMMLKRLIIGVMMVTGVVNVCLTRVKVGRRRRNEDILYSTPACRNGVKQIELSKNVSLQKN